MRKDPPMSNNKSDDELDSILAKLKYYLGSTSENEKFDAVDQAKLAIQKEIERQVLEGRIEELNLWIDGVSQIKGGIKGYVAAGLIEDLENRIRLLRKLQEGNDVKPN